MANLSAIRNNEPTTNANAARVDMKLEVVVIPVSDVDRAKEFYARLGWRLDADFTAADDWRGVQFTPPGSGCSVIFGKNGTTAAPGSAQGLYLAVSDVETARKELLRRGVEVSEVFHGSNVHTGPDEPYLFGRLRASGPDPAHTSYFSFASFHDPDGNGCCEKQRNNMASMKPRILSTTGRDGTPPISSLVRTARRPKRPPKRASATSRAH
jgi:catechol 2,3-dioxygenase-like lactoylglutathione lyase family enzyme